MTEGKASFSVMQVVDTLKLAGMETVAADYASLLSERHVRSYLCSTRASGPLTQKLSPRVVHLDLQRKGLIGLAALKRLVGFIRQRQVDIIHAHGTSLFYSALAALFVPRCRLIWHDHFGRYLTEVRPAGLYRLALRRATGVIAVNEALATWARGPCKVPATRVWFVPNFVVKPPESRVVPDLPGTPGKRIVCVANLRPEKDHLTLMDAMKSVVEVDPSASLLLVGDHANQAQAAKVQERVRRHSLQSHVFILGSRSDVWSILQGCDIGVLSSASEGMPLALLEYGSAGLPTVATCVGQVPEVLDEGRAGLLVPPGQPAELANALLRLLQSTELRKNLGEELERRRRANYSETALMDQILKIYGVILGRVC